MLEIKKAFDHLTEDELNHLMDMPAWLALLAAYRSGGRLSHDQRSVALKLIRMRRYTAPRSLQELYHKIGERFAGRFEQFAKRLPTGHDNKMTYIMAQIRRAEAILRKLDDDVATGIKKSLSSYYKHVFNADKSIFQYFAFPVISNRLEKQSGKFEFELS
jgi:hypothetical protein